MRRRHKHQRNQRPRGHAATAALVSARALRRKTQAAHEMEGLSFASGDATVVTSRRGGRSRVRKPPSLPAQRGVVSAPALLRASRRTARPERPSAPLAPHEAVALGGSERAAGWRSITVTACTACTSCSARRTRLRCRACGAFTRSRAVQAAAALIRRATARLPAAALRLGLACFRIGPLLTVAGPLAGVRAAAFIRKSRRSKSSRSW